MILTAIILCISAGLFWNLGLWVRVFRFPSDSLSWMLQQTMYVARDACLIWALIWTIVGVLV